ncbi:MAG: tetratricopeptide repeat protein [Acidobacteria bacterium]|nr:tetratricopeptide repeat protein [Acidobacteriota bacterium]
MRRRSMFFVSASLLLGILPLAAGSTAAAQVSASGAAKAALLDQRGLKQLRHGDLDAAEHSFRKALELGPDDPDAYHGLGRVAMRRHDYREALSYLLRARELYARRAAQAGATRLEAAAELDRHRRSASDQAASFADAGCLTERGVDLWMSSPQSGGETDGPGGVDLRGTPPGLSFRIGTCQLHLGHFEAARTELERELLIAPGNAAAHLNLAVVLLRLDQPAQALEELDTAVRLGAKEPKGLRSDIVAARR